MINMLEEKLLKKEYLIKIVFLLHHWLKYIRNKYNLDKLYKTLSVFL